MVGGGVSLCLLRAGAGAAPRVPRVQARPAGLDFSAGVYAVQGGWGGIS